MVGEVPAWVWQRVGYGFGLSAFFAGGEEGEPAVAPFLLLSHDDGSMSVRLPTSPSGDEPLDIEAAREEARVLADGEVWRGLCYHADIGGAHALVEWYSAEGYTGFTVWRWERRDDLDVDLVGAPSTMVEVEAGRVRLVPLDEAVVDRVVEGIEPGVDHGRRLTETE